MLAAPKPKHALLPLLVVLFLISYGLMTMLIVEQGRTIDTQRYLIRELFQDSAKLSAMRGNAEHQQAQPKARARAKAPSSQAMPGGKAGSNHSISKLRKPMPQKPPKDTSDTADERRSVTTI
jgi:hypothetical protein